MADASALEQGKPFGDDTIFDPLGLAEKATPLELKKYQEAELKHGRVAMLATVGYLLQESFHPLFNLGTDIGPALRHFQLIEAQVPWFWEATVFIIGLFEANNIARGWQKQDVYTQGIADLKEDYIVGDLGFDPLGLGPTDEPEKFNELRTKELNNGRLAMIAIFGFWAQELVYGQEILANLSN
jgi:light-harvesting complex I chlorophyll a/b binding protein 1